MFKDKIKELIQKLKNNGDKKKIENLIVLVIILIITIIAINAIWNEDKKDSHDKTEDVSLYKKLAEENDKSNIEIEDELERKLQLILSRMNGVGNVSVMLTYTQGSEIIPMQNENTKISTIHEEDSDGGKRETQETDKSTEIIYSSNNTPETRMIINPVVKGAIIIAEGASDATVKTNIVSAVEAITGLATYKVQVFEMKT